MNGVREAQRTGAISFVKRRVERVEEPSRESREKALRERERELCRLCC